MLLVLVYSTLADGRSGPPPNLFLYSLHPIVVWPWGKLSAHHFGSIYRGLASRPLPQSGLPINSILVLNEGPLVRVHNLALLAAVVCCIEAIGHRTSVQTAVTSALFVIQVIFLELLSNLRRIPSRGGGTDIVIKVSYPKILELGGQPIHRACSHTLLSGLSHDLRRLI